MSVYSYLKRRSYGFKSNFGDEDRFCKQISSSFTFGGYFQQSSYNCGSVFNLEFSDDGKILAAACEKRCIALYDAHQHTQYHTVNNAHEDYVNCVKFLDGRMLASCSDDKSVIIWDIRNLKSKVFSLKSHTNWVKNIEYLPERSLLLTSGFDGNICTWYLNRARSGVSSVENKRVLQVSDLIRTCLSPDHRKLVLSTSSGYLMVIHDLCLDTLVDDLRGFKPSLYFMMQISRTPFPRATKHTHLFSASRRRNRVELISDFPERHNSDMVTSLAMHPFGWCVASRVTSATDPNIEFTSLHDIQANELFTNQNDLEAETRLPVTNQLMCGRGVGAANDCITSQSSHTVDSLIQLANNSPLLDLRIYDTDVRNQSTRTPPSSTMSPSQSPTVGSRPNVTAASPERIDDFSLRNSGYGPRAAMQIRFTTRVQPSHALAGRGVELRVPSEDIVEALRMITDARHRHLSSSSASDTVSGDSSHLLRQDRINQVFPGRPVVITRSMARYSTLYKMNPPSQDADSAISDPSIDSLIARNRNRLLRYAYEVRTTGGFIKELSFSPDGRLVCSPHLNGVRLLTYDPSACELNKCVPTAISASADDSVYKCMHVLCTIGSHPRPVVTARFSPTACCGGASIYLLTGCLGGKIGWHMPRL